VPSSPTDLPVRPHDRSGRVATALVAVGACGLGALYLRHGLVAPPPDGEPAATRWLGVDQWAFVGARWAGLFAAAAALAGLAVAWRPDLAARAAAAVGRALDGLAVRAAIAAAVTVVCWMASSRRENLDGSLLQQKIADAVPRSGAFVTHDEMLELYLHSRLWAVMHATLGWDVAQTYRAASCVGGGVAAFVALGLVLRLPRARRLLAAAGLLAGGWVLVFFGDVENYTWANVVVLVYLAAALRFLDDERARLWPAAAALATGALFHLETLVLGPSLLVLAAVAAARGRRGEAVAAVLLVPGVLAAALGWFDVHGLPVADLFTHSQISAQGGNWSRFLAPADAHYLWNQIQLVLLLAPAVVLLPALLVDRGFRGDPRTVFLSAAAAGGLLLAFLWRAQLGPAGDWDLYAVAAQPLALLVVTWLTAGPQLRTRAPRVVVLLVLAATHTAAWIAANHAAPAVGTSLHL
jgi:hypothetical protein